MHKVGIKAVANLEFVDNKVAVQGITARVFEWRFQDVDLLADIIKFVDNKLDFGMYRVLVDVEGEYSFIFVMLDVVIS